MGYWPCDEPGCNRGKIVPSWYFWLMLPLFVLSVVVFPLLPLFMWFANKLRDFPDCPVCKGSGHLQPPCSPEDVFRNRKVKVSDSRIKNTERPEYN